MVTDISKLVTQLRALGTHRDILEHLPFEIKRGTLRYEFDEEKNVLRALVVFPANRRSDYLHILDKCRDYCQLEREGTDCYVFSRYAAQFPLRMTVACIKEDNGKRYG